MFDPSGVIIDGALPRTPQERINKLIAHCEDIASAIVEDSPTGANFKADYLAKIAEFNNESVVLYQQNDDPSDLYSLENDICQHIADGANYLNPTRQMHVFVGEHSPGDVVVRETAESMTRGMLKDIAYFLKTRLYTQSQEEIVDDEGFHRQSHFSFLFTDTDSNDYIVSITGPEEC